MQFSSVMLFRGLGYDVALEASASYFRQGFIATAKDKSCGYRFNNYLRTYINEVYLVSRKQNPNVPRDSGKFDGKLAWINVSLTVDDVSEIEAWLLTEPDILTEICQLVLSGFSISCKPSHDGNSYMATLTGSADTTDGHLSGLSAYAATPYEALACLLFKFVSKLDGRLHGSTSAGASRFR